MIFLKCLFSGISGGFFGVVFCLATSTILIEVTYHNYFGYIFGSFIFLFGVYLLIRTFQMNNVTRMLRFLAFLLTSFVLGSGILIGAVDNQWFFETTNSLRILYYSVMSISIMFILVYSLIEVLNSRFFNCLCCKSDNPKPFVLTKPQVYCGLIGGVIIGLVNGILFGSFDVENTSKSYHDFHIFQIYIIPIGFVIGFILGFWNEYLREKVFQERISLGSMLDDHYFGDETSAVENDDKDNYTIYGVGYTEEY
ncbi:hypothetical protein M0813_18237 [Anaeramoeba flamelloides]|uniref:DUF4203 domain-containing protein n=1 Tax=Anaeramoeba flamelloides TaxID=1746091 RepID=A0ABQ8YSP4_9EUKA|nr:hypothetical protein M0813_18237 [Anaeramoeba flamelloides]